MGTYQRKLQVQLRMTISSLLPHGENFGYGTSGVLVFSSLEDILVFMALASDWVASKSEDSLSCQVPSED